LSGLLIGVLSLQGDLEEHHQTVKTALSKIGTEGEVISVKDLADVKRIDGLIIPGGESTVMGGLSSIKGIMPALRERVGAGLPVLGTCAGMIMLAKKVYDRVVGETKQSLIGTMNITVERNSFGRQGDSFETTLDLDLPGCRNFRAVFIRAPLVKSIEQGVKELARFQGDVVAVQQGAMIGTSFHPELSGSTLVHEYFIGLAKAYKKN
jgi:5'-phosphate synthase pdxT subunit